MAGTSKAVTLCFIAATQEGADALIEKYGKYFDDVVFRVGLVSPDGPTFSDARNELIPQVKTPYWFWMDDDDEIAGIENLRPLIAQMEDQGLDALYMEYEYAYNEQGECIVLQWRERLVRTAHNFRWLGTVHESLISQDGPRLERTKGMKICHTKSQEDMAQAAERNHKFLIKAHRTDKDPRTTHYLALSFFNLREYPKAIKLFNEHIRTSGWDEDKYRSIFYIGQAYGLRDEYENALTTAMRGIALLPNRPEAYVLAASAEMEMGNYGKVLEHLISAGTKEPPVNTLSAIDPTYYTYRAEFLAALAHLHLGNVEAGHEQLKRVLEASPNFEEAKRLAPLFQELYDDRNAVSKIEWLSQYYQAYGGKPQKIFEGLPKQLLSDPRLNTIRTEIFPAVKWSSKSIVFFCGQAAEQWGPDTLKNGMGGSEEAIVYLSRALAELGWEVTVYCDRDEEMEDIGGVQYKPWNLFNPHDEFHIVIAWRNPSFFRTLPVRAKFKGVDMHDMVFGHQTASQADIDSVDKFFFKSHFQAEASLISPAKYEVISNGIVSGQFDHKIERNPLKVVYGSSADRGLEALLAMWPEIKKQVPEAELHWYYGWNSYDQFHREKPKLMKWKWEMIRKLHKAGVIDHGRVDHETLAKEYLSGGVWAYPTQFPEINCITALKAQAAGLTPITSGYAALQEVVQIEEDNDNETIYKSKEAQDRFVARVVHALKHPETEEVRSDRAKRIEDQYDWKVIASKWDYVLK